MTHKDIYTKFMIEYDKANVTSSYPSLTEYEVATLLDKAYLALIAQKVTGNNPRRAPFEADNKAIADIEPLIAHADQELFNNGHTPAINITQYKLPKDFLYYVASQLNHKIRKKSVNNDRLEEPEVYTPVDSDFEDIDNDIWIQRGDVYYGDEIQQVEELQENQSGSSESNSDGLPYDQKTMRLLPIKLVQHQVAERFFSTPYNMPWIKIPVCYIEGGTVYVVYDLLNTPIVTPGNTVHLSYIKKPKSFVAGLTQSDVVEDEPVQSNNFILDQSILNGSDVLS